MLALAIVRQRQKKANNSLDFTDTGSVYMYRLVGDAKNFDATEATTNISKHWCKSAEGADFRKIDAVILYRYFDSQGAPVQEIKIKTKDCK